MFLLSRIQLVCTIDRPLPTCPSLLKLRPHFIYVFLIYLLLFPDQLVPRWILIYSSTTYSFLAAEPASSFICVRFIYVSVPLDIPPSLTLICPLYLSFLRRLTRGFSLIYRRRLVSVDSGRRSTYRVAWRKQYRIFVALLQFHEREVTGVASRPMWSCVVGCGQNRKARLWGSHSWSQLSATAIHAERRCTYGVGENSMETC